MLPRALILALFLLPPAQAEVIPLDPRIAFDDLIAHARQRPTAERIDVRVFSDGATRSDTILFQFVPPATIQASLGRFTLWSDSQTLRVAHHLDQQAYFESPVEGRDTLRAVGSVLPPIPAPHFALALSDDPMSELTPYTRGIRWTDARVDDSTRPATLSIRGESDRARVTILADASTGRIRSMKTHLDGDRARIELTCTPLDPAETPSLGIDPGRRHPTRDISELHPRLPRVIPGDPFASIELLSWRTGNELPETVPGPAAVIFLRRWKPGESPHRALNAADTIAKERPGFSVFLALILEPGLDDPRALIDGAQSEAPRIPLLHSHSPADTIERISTADRLLVLIDKEGVVRAITDLPPPNDINADELLSFLRDPENQ